ncbi:MAG: tetratricopeptide repeat protein [Planctomycetaceae bacterium]|nr:tetratricopeptide repeat protein [Planctomycetaceae bacterium]
MSPGSPTGLGVVCCAVGLVALVVYLVWRSDELVPDHGPRPGEFARAGSQVVASSAASAVGPMFPDDANSQQRLDALTRAADQLVARFPTDPEALSLAGQIHQLAADYSMAQRYWETCLQLHPTHIDALASLGHSLWKQGEFDQAIIHLEKAFAAHRQLPEKYMRALAESLLHEGRCHTAIDALELWRGSQTSTPEILLLLGQAYLQVKQYEKAREQCQRVLQGDPQCKEAHYMLTRILPRLGDTQGAASHREEFARLERQAAEDVHANRAGMREVDFHEDRPLMATFWFYAAMIYAQRGDWREAEQYCRTAVQLDPRNRDARRFVDMSIASRRQRPTHP